MAKLSTYKPNPGINPLDKITYSGIIEDYEDLPTYETVSTTLKDLGEFFAANYFSADGVVGNLIELQSTIDSTEAFVGNLSTSIGSFNLDGTLVSLSTTFANDMLNATTLVPTSFANNVFSVVTVTETFANEVLGLATTINTTIQASLDSLTADLLDTNLLIDNVNLDVTSLTSTVSANGASITNNATSISALGTSINTVDASVTALQLDVTSLTSSVNANTGSISTNATSISALTTTVATTDLNVSNLSADITSLTTTVNGHTGEISTNATNISTLNTSLTSTVGSLNLLQTEVTTLTSAVNTNTGDITATAASLSVLATEVTTAKADITAIDTSLTTLSSTVDGNTGAIDVNAASISTLSTSVTTAENSILANSANIVTLNTAVGDNASDITVNATAITSLGVQITNETSARIAAITTVDQAIIDEASARVSSDNTLTSAISIKPNIYRQNAAPAVTVPVGSIWYDADDGNKMYVLVAGAPNVWTETTDTRLAAVVDSNATALESIDTLSSDLGAEASKISKLQAQYTFDTNGDVNGLASGTTVSDAVNNAYNTAVADADAAAASRVDTLSATISKVYRQAAAPTGTIVTNSIWYDTDDGNKSYLYDGTSWVYTVDAALATTASVSTNTTAISGINGKLSASYAMHVVAGNKVAGLKLLADGTTTSSFIAKADEFGVEMPDGTRVLTVDTNGLVINGSGTFSGELQAGKVNINSDNITITSATDGVYSNGGNIIFTDSSTNQGAIRSSTFNSLGVLDVSGEDRLNLGAGVASISLRNEPLSVYQININGQIYSYDGAFFDGDLTASGTGYIGGDLTIAGAIAGEWVSHVQNGYTKIHNGTLIQWGKTTTSSDGIITIYFPTTFTEVYSVTTSGSASENVNALTTSYFQHDRLNIVDSTKPVYWIAIGK